MRICFVSLYVSILAIHIQRINSPCRNCTHTNLLASPFIKGSQFNFPILKPLKVLLKFKHMPKSCKTKEDLDVRITHCYPDVDLMNHQTFLKWLKLIERPLLIEMLCRLGYIFPHTAETLQYLLIQPNAFTCFLVEWVF